MVAEMPTIMKKYSINRNVNRASLAVAALETAAIYATTPEFQNTLNGALGAVAVGTETVGLAYITLATFAYCGANLLYRGDINGKISNKDIAKTAITFCLSAAAFMNIFLVTFGKDNKFKATFKDPVVRLVEKMNRNYEAYHQKAVAPVVINPAAQGPR